LLEFGVRSGYSAVVFAKAMEGKACHYTGVDPNLYIPGGLKKASETFRILQTEDYDFRYFLLEGFSSSENIQKSLQYSGPFDMIHVDGEHTYFGKIYDLWIAAKLLSKGGFVLVDDFEHHGMIADSIKVALQMGWFSRFSYFPTKRGMAVLSR
jgi:predicted O-methyltransferase YrrM